MAKPIWIDNSTIGDIAAGDVALEAEVLAKKQVNGGNILMVPKVKEETLFGNPFTNKWESNPQNIQAREAVIKRMNIQLDTMGSVADRQVIIEAQFKFKNKGREAVRAIEESDAIIMSQIYASAKARNVSLPELFTTDKRLTNNADAKLFKVSIVPRTSTPVLLRNILKRLDEARIKLRNHYDLYSGEHKTQLDLYNNNFAGFWTNRLFNSTPPDTAIWSNAYARLLAVDRHLRNKDVVKAYVELKLARLWYLFAYKRYVTWTHGIEAAGTKMHWAIGSTAVAVVTVTIGGLFAVGTFEWGIFAAEATQATSVVAGEQAIVRAGQTLARIEGSIANAERILEIARAAEAAALEEAAILEAEREAAAALSIRMIP